MRREKSISRSVRPARFISEPVKMKKGIAISENESMPPKNCCGMMRNSPRFPVPTMPSSPAIVSEA